MQNEDKKPKDRVRCWKCEGQGIVSAPEEVVNVFYKEGDTWPCNECGGTGFVEVGDERDG